MVSIVLLFKGEDSIDGEPVGPLYISDEDDPGAWVGHPYEKDGSPGAWMRLDQARAWAESRGYRFEADV
jgi:hypothetical protein